MLRPEWRLPFYLLLFVCLIALPACKKKKAAEPNNPNLAPPGMGQMPIPGGGGAPGAVSSDYLLYAHINVKAIRASKLFTEIKQSVTKAGGPESWNKVEDDAVKEMGFRPSYLNSVTMFMPAFPTRGDPKAVVIFNSSTLIDKAKVSLIQGQKPDSNGVYKTKGKDGLIHFPDGKTMVILSQEFADKYLAGYARNRAGWPMTAGLTTAAGNHALYFAVNLQKLPKKDIPVAGSPQLESLIAAQSVTLTGDLRGKSISLGARATFPDAAAAEKARETVQQFLGMAAGFVGQAMNDKEVATLTAVKTAVQEAQRTLKEAKVEASGSDLTLAATYNANFDFNTIASEVVPKIQMAANRTTALNCLKQIGLALHNYHDAYGRLPIYATGAKGVAIRNDKDKPLLSWRVAILPFIEQENLYRQFKLDEPWDSENNKKLIEKMPKLFAPVNKPGKPGYTHLQMVIGPGALRPDMGILSITDGTSNTIAVVEAAEPVIWTKPDDVMVPGKEMPKDFKKKFGGQFPGGFNVAMWDGSAHFVPDSISDHTLWLAVGPTDGMPLPKDWYGGSLGGPGATIPKKPDGFIPPRPPSPPGGFKK